MLSSGINQMAGQSQSPMGSLAVTSMRPYFMVFLAWVVRRAERTGLMIVPEVLLLVTAH